MNKFLKKDERDVRDVHLASILWAAGCRFTRCFKQDGWIHYVYKTKVVAPFLEKHYHGELVINSQEFITGLSYARLMIEDTPEEPESATSLRAAGRIPK